MTNQIDKPTEKTLGEFLKINYPEFEIVDGDAPLDMDISHGLEIEYNKDTSLYGNNRESLNIYPYIKWSDGLYKPCHYWGSEYYLRLKKN